MRFIGCKNRAPIGHLESILRLEVVSDRRLFASTGVHIAT